LIALKDRVPALESSVNSALASIGTSEAVPPLLQSLAADPQTALKRIADLGSNGYSAGPKVMEYLGDPRWDVRVAAAGALGRISYTPAESALQMALSDQDDWKLVYSAVIALGHLKSGASIEALKRVRDSHWYPPVRERASSVIEQIKTGSPAKESGWWQYAKLDDAPESCTRVAEKTVVESKERKLYSNPDLFDLARLAREAAKRTYGPEVGRDSDKNGSTSTFDKRRQIPQVALKVQDGWLGGTDHGEWGGELIYMPASGANVVLAEKNTRDIFLLGDQLVAITGLAHLGMNDGMLLRVDRDALGGFVATPWKRLPAAPDTSKLVEGGVLLVNSQGAGSISIDRSGKIRMATCL
jgi:hypothetical protein